MIEEEGECKCTDIENDVSNKYEINFGDYNFLICAPKGKKWRGGWFSFCVFFYPILSYFKSSSLHKNDYFSRRKQPYLDANLAFCPMRTKMVSQTVRPPPSPGESICISVLITDSRSITITFTFTLMLRMIIDFKRPFSGGSRRYTYPAQTLPGSPV